MFNPHPTHIAMVDGERIALASVPEIYGEVSYQRTRRLNAARDEIAKEFKIPKHYIRLRLIEPKSGRKPKQ